MRHPTIPPCEALAPNGARVLIRPHALTDSVADLARAFDLPATAHLAIDDRPVSPHDRLAATRLRVGSAITVAPPDRVEPVAVPSAAAEVAVVVGPGCARRVALAAGRHTVGRAALADVRVDDPAVELHHGVLDVDADGSVTFTQLTGAFPATLDGVACETSQVTGRGCTLTIGSSRLQFGRTAAALSGTTTRPDATTGSVVAADADPWRSIVRRGPAGPLRGAPDTLDVPVPPAAHRAPPLTGLVGAGVAALGAGLLAMVLGHVLFAVFAAVGAVASVATWSVGALVARRDRRRGAASHRRAVDDFERALHDAHASAVRTHRLVHRNVTDALDLVHGDGAGVWSQRPTDTDPLWVTVGRGTTRWPAPVDADGRDHLTAELLVVLEQCEQLHDVDVPLALEPGAVVAYQGSSRMIGALCRSTIVQLAARYGPADWELQVVTDDPDRWDWTRWLPHADGRRSVVDATDMAAMADAMEPVGAGGGQRRTVVVLDVPALLSARTGPVRRRLERGDVTCIALVDRDESVPAIVDRVLEVGDTGAARWRITNGAAWASTDRNIVVAGVSTSTAYAAARRLAPLVDPEQSDPAGGVPASVSLAELEPVDDHAATAIARRWRHAGPDPAPIARLGESADGVVDVDLVRDGPHGLIAGTTGSGKSELLRTLVVSLAAQSSPEHLTLILVDYKGGSTFDACARLPHTVGVVTDLDEGLAARMLVSLDAEVRRRERLLRAVQADDLADYRRACEQPLPRLVVVIDEFASLAKELPDFLGALVAIAQRGRSLGIHLVLATQRPAGVVTDDIRANTNLRVALRLQDRSDADDVVGDATPAGFPVGIPGRAALRLGPDELVVFQTASAAGPVPVRPGRLTVEFLGPEDRRRGRRRDPPEPPGDRPSVLDHLVDSICAAASLVATRQPHRPWIDALPDVLRPCELGDDGDAVGLLDDPGEQCRRPLRWTPTGGNLLLVGAVGTGTTTAAVAVTSSLVRSTGADALHVYVIDAQGESGWTTFEPIAHCGAVVRITETERLERLLRRLGDELERRSADSRRRPTVVVVIDGYATVRDALGAISLGEASMRLDRLLRDGPGVGIVAVVTTDGSSSAGLAVPRAETWVFHLTDQGAARTAGLRAPVVAAGRPGRCRMVASGLEGQIVSDPDPWRGAPTAGDATVGAPAPVEVLPALIDPTPLDRGSRCPGHGEPRHPEPDRGSRCPGHGEPRGWRAEGEPDELVVGLAADDLGVVALRVPVGDHVFIGGAARTGRSTALRQIEAAWRTARPDDPVVRVERRRPIADQLADQLADVIDGCGDGRRLLLVVDDADRVDDPDGTLGRMLARPDVTIAVAARLDAVRVAYGHWTRDVARSRCGLIMTSNGELDGELLGATLPRRSSIPPRPGLAWMIDQRGHRLVQVAARMPP